MGASEPDIKPFAYCLLPADKEAPVVERRFEGTSDKELRKQLAAYFGEEGITTGQTEAFKEHMIGEMDKNAQKATSGGEGGEATVQTPEQKQMAAALMESAVAQQGGSFEIVPVIYPDANNGYTGTSLYIDQVGRFKELPLNERASALSQRDIRGDAFILRNYDDPVADSWARIDCTKEMIDGLLSCPPEKSEDPQARAAAMQAAMATTKVTPEMLGKARDLRQAGNDAFREAAHGRADEQYTAALKELKGRTDDVDADEVGELIKACLLNRAQCRLKQGQLRLCEEDCTAVLHRDPRALKALFRRAQARRQARDYGAALADVARAREVAPDDAEVAKLLRLTERDRAEHAKKEKERYSGMFGGGKRDP